MLVHPYTLRAEESFLTQAPNGVAQSALGEAVQLYGLGVQGFFIDQPDIGVAARDIFLAQPVQTRALATERRADGRGNYAARSPCNFSPTRWSERDKRLRYETRLLRCVVDVCG